MDKPLNDRQYKSRFSSFSHTGHNYMTSKFKNKKVLQSPAFTSLRVAACTRPIVSGQIELELILVTCNIIERAKLNCYKNCYAFLISSKKVQRIFPPQSFFQIESFNTGNILAKYHALVPNLPSEYWICIS